MYFRNLTRGVEIGANAYLLCLGDSRILLDAGLHPRNAGNEALPALGLLGDDSIDAVILSHAHLDHAGALPVVLRHHPSAQLLATEPTRDLAVAMLHNSVNVMNSQREELGITEYPLFTHREVNHLESHFHVRPARMPFRIGKPADEITCEFFDAGHILGAVGILIRYRGDTIFYTGDVHFEDQSLSKAAVFPEHPLDVVICESTRGAEDRAPGYTRAGEIASLGCAIKTALERGGTVLIPVFATGKTQETLLVLHQLQKTGSIPEVPVFIGGLSAKMTAIYDRHCGASHRHHGGFRILEEMNLGGASPSRGRGRRGRGRKGAAGIPYLPGSIYALSSGMMTENTLSNRFAQKILPSERDAIFLVGYAAPDSPAGRIRDARPGESVLLAPDAPALARACRVQRFDFSGHATREAIVSFLRGASPSLVLLVHGDETATARLGAALREELPFARIAVPAPGDTIPLATTTPAPA